MLDTSNVLDVVYEPTKNRTIRELLFVDDDFVGT